MQNINETLKKLANNQNFQARYEALRQQVMNDKRVKEFLEENAEHITREMLDQSMTKLYEFTNQSKGCKDCKSLEACKNMIQGYEPKLFIRGNYIDIKYDKCKKKVMHDEQQKHVRLINSIFVPKEILKASFGDIELDDQGRFKAIKMAKDFVENYQPGRKQKGMFLHGPFGTGKSYLLGAIANELAQKQVSSLIVYVPEFFREMKNAIGDHTVNDKLEAIKKANVLMLDDIGAETMSSWARDEILGTILQFRMLENLPTFFTSNFDLKGLEHHLTHSQRGEEEQLKAARIMERIKYLADPVKVEGKNRRM
ncbi:primosomal protein DnaI [Mesobacillus subterraneus]|uniref:primosomal protein DnaI n=1 Tax=Mesobacillus subterraneus TaxID=285983 RepID=UPI00203D630C|nr:primosomal protein DnaI [Mesobacillus subterraneus]MCM3663744.1 primosomal protein DnaI [Mesobacillus subterraneus]MCM3683506.1 primosomal protein DnaI [Mesobacillus subterraneus]